MLLNYGLVRRILNIFIYIYDDIKDDIDNMRTREILIEMYENEDCCFFRNYVQAAHYYSWGCELVDLFVDSNMKWVYVFWKSDHMISRLLKPIR